MPTPSSLAAARALVRLSDTGEVTLAIVVHAEDRASPHQLYAATVAAIAEAIDRAGVVTVCAEGR